MSAPDTEAVHWVGDAPTSLHGNGAGSFARTTRDAAEVTCRLCLSILELDPPVAPARDVETVLAEVLGRHATVKSERVRTSRGISTWSRFCQCGEELPWSSAVMSARHRTHVAAEQAAALSALEVGEALVEWAATDATSVELEQWPDATTIRATREAAEAEFVHDGDDVLLRRTVTPWAPVPAAGQGEAGADRG